MVLPTPTPTVSPASCRGPNSALLLVMEDPIYGWEDFLDFTTTLDFLLKIGEGNKVRDRRIAGAGSKELHYWFYHHRLSNYKHVSDGDGDGEGGAVLGLCLCPTYASKTVNSKRYKGRLAHCFKTYFLALIISTYHTLLTKRSWNFKHQNPGHHQSLHPHVFLMSIITLAKSLFHERSS